MSLILSWLIRRDTSSTEEYVSRHESDDSEGKEEQALMVR
jgi:hypothetical protein